MCWSATTSFVTLGLGTSFNILSYWILSRVYASPASTFVWWWQYALLMQIPEGIVWSQLDRGDRNVEAASRAALFLNITQPVVLFLGLAFASPSLRGEVATWNRARVAIALYSLALLSEMDELWNESASVAPAPGCSHLDLRYWDRSRATLYVVASLIIMAEARPRYWVWVNCGIFSVTLVFSMVLYPCGVGSVWCWFIFLAGPLLVIAEFVRRRVWTSAESTTVVTTVVRPSLASRRQATAV